MISNDEKIRGAITEQASEWFIANDLANDEGLQDAGEAAALAAWLKTSPVHIEEFLGVSVVARDLRAARSDPEYSLEAVLSRARAESAPPVRGPWLRLVDLVDTARVRPARRWLAATVAVAACAVLSVALLLTWGAGPSRHPAALHDITAAALHFETRHGEQLTRRLADNSVLHLNTDSAVTIQYGKNERVAVLAFGQAEFDVAHESTRAFRVVAGSAEVVDLGTKFDVRLDHDATVVTVVQGRVAVAPSVGDSPQSVELSAGEQISVIEGKWPVKPVTVDAERATAWLHREIAFNQEPLERVVAEYNRYTSKPIEIATPALRSLQISGVFATDDTEAFIAFLRSLKGVRVEVTETRIRVW
jgi:transmembrane sensor